MFEKILCPTDFSEGSKHALQVAVRLAVDHGAELVIAHAWHPSPLELGKPPFPAEAIQEMTWSVERELAAASREAASLGAKRVTTKFLTGAPWHQIVDTLSADQAYDLAVMATIGRTGLARVLLGSVTEKVVRHAPCSVLAVPSHDGAKPFVRVLCPVDFSDGSRHAMLRAGELVARGGAITLLHVVDLPAFYEAAPSLSDYLGEVDRLGTNLLEEWAADLRRNVDASVTTRMEIGSPVARSLAVLDESPGFDLVVVGSHGRTGIRRVALGSVAERIVRHAGCPVLVARPRAS